MSTVSSLAYFAIRGASGLAGVFTVSIYARLLGPSGYATWSIVLVLSALMAGVLIQPINSALSRFFPRPGGDALVPFLGRMVLMAMVAAAIVACVVDWLRPLWIPAGATFLALAVGAGQGVFDFSAQYSACRLQTQRYGRLYLAKSVIALGLGSSLLLAGFGVVGAIAATVSSYLVATALFGLEGWRTVWVNRSDRSDLREIRNYMLPLGASLLTGILLQWGDRLILAAYASGDQLGAYSAAGDLAQQGFGLLFGSFHLAWFPRLVTAWEMNDEGFQRKLDRYVQVALVVITPVVVGFFLVSAELVDLLFGRAYHSESTMVLPWLTLAAVLGGARMYFFDLPLHLAKRMRTQFMVSAVASAVAIALNLALVPIYGLVAAALVAIAAQAGGCLASFVLGRHIFRPRVVKTDVLAVFVGTCLMSIVVCIMPAAGVAYFVLKVFAGAAVYGLVLVSFDTAGGRKMVIEFLRRGRGLI